MGLRKTALHEAIAFGPARDEMALLARADLFLRFLVGAAPIRLIVTIGVPRKQHTNAPDGGPFKEAAMAQMHDDEEFDVAVRATDAKGFPVADNFTATIDDASVATVNQTDAGFTVVAGNPGSATVTFTDGALSATLAVDVVPGDATLISLETGDVRKQQP